MKIIIMQTALLVLNISFIFMLENTNYFIFYFMIKNNISCQLLDIVSEFCVHVCIKTVQEREELTCLTQLFRY